MSFKKHAILTILVISCLTRIYGFQTPAVINSSKTLYKIFDKDHMEIVEQYEITINDEKALKYATFVNYYDKFKKIKRLEMTVLDKNGNKVKKLKKSDAFDVSVGNSYEVNDNRILVLRPDYKAFPFTVKVETTSVYNGYISIPTWMPRKGYDLEVKSATLNFEYPLDYKMKFLEEHISSVNNHTIAYNLTVWEVHELEAISKEVDQKTFYNTQPKVLFSPTEFELDKVTGSFNSWRNFGDWFIKLNDGRNKLLPPTMLRLDTLKQSAKSDKALIKDIYYYMQDKTRYISIQLGIGGFQTIPSDVVEKTGYGDCKALTNYMKAMLNYVGINSNYILVKAGANAADVKEEFPSNQFNHVFLGVPLEEDTVLLECTSQMIPPDYIGKFTDGRNVLWISRDNSKIIRSRKYDHKDNVISTNGEIIISPNGGAHIYC